MLGAGVAAGTFPLAFSDGFSGVWSSEAGVLTGVGTAIPGWTLSFG